MWVPRFSHAICLFGTDVFIFGGKNEDSEEYLGECEKYSLIEDKWEIVSSLPEPRTSFNAVIVNNHIYLGGGKTLLDEAARYLYRYSPDSDTFTLIRIVMNLSPGDTSLAFYSHYLFIFTGIKCVKVDIQNEFDLYQ